MNKMPAEVWLEDMYSCPTKKRVFDDDTEYVRIDIHDAEIERLKARIVLWREAYEAVYGAFSWGDSDYIKLMDELRPGAEDNHE